MKMRADGVESLGMQSPPPPERPHRAIWIQAQEDHLRPQSAQQWPLLCAEIREMSPLPESQHSRAEEQLILQSVCGHVECLRPTLNIGLLTMHTSSPISTAMVQLMYGNTDSFIRLFAYHLTPYYCNVHCAW